MAIGGTNNSISILTFKADHSYAIDANGSSTPGIWAVDGKMLKLESTDHKPIGSFEIISVGPREACLKSPIIYFETFIDHPEKNTEKITGYEDSIWDKVGP